MKIERWRRWLWTRLFGKDREKSFVFHVTLLTGGTLVGQGLLVLLSPVLSRLYTPSAFGVFGEFISVAGVLAAVATFRYELAIPLPSEEEDAFSLAWGGALVSGAFSLLLFMLVLLAGERALVLFNIHLKTLEHQRLLLWALPFGVWFQALYQVITFLLIRYKRYRALAGSKVAAGGAAGFAQVGFGLFSSGGWGLIFGWMIGRLGAVGVGVVAERGKGNEAGSRRVFPRLNSVVREMKRYIRFPLLAMPAGLMNKLAMELPMLLSAPFFGLQVAGWFSFARRAIYSPMGLLGRSISQVYVGSLGEAISKRDEAAVVLFDRLSRRLFLASVIPFAVLGITAPFLFALIFGKPWRTSGILVQYLTPAYLAQFVMVPLSQTLNMLEKQDWQVAWDGMRLVLVGGLFFLAKVLAWDFRRTFLLYSAVLTIMYFVLYLLMRRALVRWAASRPAGGE